MNTNLSSESSPDESLIRFSLTNPVADPDSGFSSVLVTCRGDRGKYPQLLRGAFLELLSSLVSALSVGDTGCAGLAEFRALRDDFMLQRFFHVAAGTDVLGCWLIGPEFLLWPGACGQDDSWAAIFSGPRDRLTRLNRRWWGIDELHRSPASLWFGWGSVDLPKVPDWVGVYALISPGDTWYQIQLLGDPKGVSQAIACMKGQLSPFPWIVER